MVLLLTSVAGQATAGAAPPSSEWPIFDELGKQLEDQSRPVKERLEIILTFEEWAAAQVRPPLLAVLKDPLPAIRAAAAQALGWPGNVEAVPALRERVETPGEVAAVRAAVMGSLGRIGDRSVRALVIAATGAPEASVRGAALWGVALGSLVDPADRTAYLLQLVEDRAADAQMRCEAIRVLARVKEAGVADRLVRVLETEPRVRIVVPDGPPSPAENMALRFAEARDVAAWAAGALGPLEAKTALPLLSKTAAEPDDFYLRLMSVRSLVAWNVPEAYPVLVQALEDSHPEVRIMALTGVARLKDPKAVELVVARLSDVSPEVRAWAVPTLAHLGGPQVRPQLEALQQTEADPRVLRVLEAELSRLAR
jgi:HEAT repeat protein